MFDKTRRNLVLLLVAVFFAGYLSGAGSSVAAKAKSDIYEKLDIFAKVLHYVETNYVDQVEQKDLVYGAIKGMLDTLDPHTIFMPPEIYKEMKIDTTGEFQGLGLVVEVRDRRLAVINPIEDSPASKAGVKKNDIILAIDGKDTTDLSLQDAVHLMRGPVGTDVTLTISRNGQTKPMNFVLTRGHIRVTSVESRLLEPGLGYIHIKSFQDHTSTQLVSAMRKLSIESQSDLRGLVLDMRDNPGGLLEESIRIVDEFIAKGLIVTTEGRNRQHIETERAHPTGSFLKGRLVVLINGGSASASEIVAGALKDHQRALIFGNRSFGKGSVQNIIDLDDGSGLKITVARYFTPHRLAIDGNGITPDVTVMQPETLLHLAEGDLDKLPEGAMDDLTDETGLKLLQSVRAPKSIEEDDHQLRAAYAYLKIGKLP